MDKDNNYTKIPNELLEALYTMSFSALQNKIINYVARKTLGWNKKFDDISISKAAQDMQKDYRNVRRGFQQLENMGVLEIHNRRPGKPSKIGLRDVRFWFKPVSIDTQVKGRAKNTQVPVSSDTQAPRAKNTQVPVSSDTHTKEKKDNIKKIKETPYIPHETNDRFADKSFREMHTAEEVQRMREKGWE